MKKLRQTIVQLLQQEVVPLLQKETEQNTTHLPLRAAEAIFAFYIDDGETRQTEIVNVLKELQQEKIFTELANASIAILTGKKSKFDFAEARGRVRDRRSNLHRSALELATMADITALRHLPAKNLRLALQAANPKQAASLIAAWNALSKYEQTHT